MRDQRPESDLAEGWQSEASEELRAAEVMAEHAEIADRVAGFHAHLAAEKALKALLIRRGVEMPRIHDLIGLSRLLPEGDQSRTTSGLVAPTGVGVGACLGFCGVVGAREAKGVASSYVGSHIRVDSTHPVPGVQGSGRV